MLNPNTTMGRAAMTGRSRLQLANMDVHAPGCASTASISARAPASRPAPPCADHAAAACTLGGRRDPAMMAVRVLMKYVE
uniref:Uncharacterized protein n=1 Tax=Human herpesvirus 1 TaxID=10298 RepID=A0A2Z4H3Z0_HHV1|nr:hypothetical protein [Human alphaherpesvirus 1]AWW09479.1 hypothetical protein [Human alphaherpesvirus 1]AWW09950.1 hypothetical protein [Human alphaherpesvirus 1]AWW10943.1 hypothetical protein [Human alphaherpesvirus 1]